MENIVFFSLNVFLIMGIWFFCFKPAVKARKKVELELLRQDVDKFFQENSRFSQNKSMIKKLHDVITDTERTLDQVSLSAYIAWTMEVEKNEELRNAIDKEINEKFYVKDKEFAEFIDKVRNSSSLIGISYMIESSFFLLLLGVSISLCIFTKELFQKGKITFKNIRPNFETKAEKIFKADFIEQQSFFSAKLC